MIRSMTGFARQEQQTRWGLLSWELRSVNHRFLDVSARLPEDFRSLETQTRELAAQYLGRGKLECNLRFQAAVGVETALVLNEDLVRQLLQAKGTLEAMMENPARVNTLELLKWPGVLRAAETDLGELQGAAAELLKASLAELVGQRQREGEKIKALIQQRCQAIRDEVAAVRAQLPAIMAGQKKRLHDRLAELSAQLDQGRLEQELAYLAQKIDVAEELDRLELHVDEVSRVLEQDDPVGRRLDFLMQELNREANTLGSKSVDQQTTKASVELKVIIEQMREQIQNIE